jgi:5-methylthioribose kinase
LRGTLADTSLFDELRVDPYYRTIARAHPQIAPRIEALIDAMELPPEQRTLVLGDFSPKNILVHSAGLVLLDFECAHGGDAAFDLGFFLSHLLLKAIRAAKGTQGAERPFLELTLRFLEDYLKRVGTGPWQTEGLLPRAIDHAAACLLARIDGKSPVDYLDPSGQALARRLALEALDDRPRSWQTMLGLLERELHQQR